MVRHIVAWNYADGFSEQENKENARKVKSELEALADKIGGVIELKVYTDMLPGSSRDVILTSLFESPEALDAYLVHPEHQRAAMFVRSVMTNRACVDYIEA